jgi:UDP-N-acetylmuramate dehydrogenase
MNKKLIDFSKFSSIKIGPKVEVLVIERGDKIPNNRFLVGGANNLLVSPMPPPLMMLGKSYDYIEIKDNFLEVGCATKTGRLLSFAKKHNIANLEFIAKLPGTIGGMVAMNAGVKSYEIFNIIKRVKINGVWVDKKDIKYGYRFAKLNGIATAIELNLEYGYSQELRDELLKLRNNQPKEPSAGSAFKNPKDDFAGRLIQEVGLKGYRVGNMAFSQIHANFLVNLGSGTFQEAMELIELAKSKVKDKFNIELKEEIKIV